MRIIDKQHDFYDYLQDPTDRIVFDRRGSFLLTKELFCEGLRYQRYCTMVTPIIDLFCFGAALLTGCFL